MTLVARLKDQTASESRSGLSVRITDAGQAMTCQMRLEGSVSHTDPFGVRQGRALGEKRGDRNKS